VTPAERLTDDLLVEILSRVSAKSLCRFKCVSKRWLSLVDHPDHRRKLPQTMVGFFYRCTNKDRTRFQFTSVMRGSCRPLINTSLTFLPNHRRVILLDACNGLLLCMWFTSAQGTEFRYVVCNPATGKWAALPDPDHACDQDTVHLGFDPAVSSHFYVFALLEKDYGEWNPYLCGVEVYSSQTGRWLHKEDEWNDTQLCKHQLAHVFLNGYLHFHAFDCVSSRCLAVVDTKGEVLTHIRVPGGMNTGFIQQSQGRLHYANFKRDEDSGVIRLVVYVLDNYVSKTWTLKHSVETSYVFGEKHVCTYADIDRILIHPDCNLIFFTLGPNIFTRYNMDSRQVKVIPDTINGRPPYLPYVPFYSALPSLDT
jgi:F-box interacting protein